MTENDHANFDEQLQRWRESLSSLLQQSLFTHINRVHVIGEVASTQDACRHNVISTDGLPGVAITTFRQIAGRGRLGRSWHDPDGHGVACSVAVRIQSPERLALAGALAACLTVENVADHTLSPRIRWPNDVMLPFEPANTGWRKVAGVLVEVPAERTVAIIGIGINVSQQSWPPPLDTTAVSLAQAGCNVSRLDVISELIRNLDDTLDWTDSQLAQEFRRRDMLVGATAALEHNGRRYTGRVLDIDPLEGLCIQQPDGTVVTLPILTTSMIHE